MNENFNQLREPKTPGLAGASGAMVYIYPDDVVCDGSLTKAEKRAVLASWMSDSRAVENAPSLRRLDSGCVVEVDAIRRALFSLDAAGPVGTDERRVLARSHPEPLVLARWLSNVVSRNRGNDDDDDPPPAPAGCGIPFRPRQPAGSGALELIAA
jgi:hypothetical protein